MGGEVRIPGQLVDRMSAKGGTEAFVEVERAFIAVGCNRVVGALSWGPCDLVAFAAHNGVAIFCPKESRILVTLPGHKDLVNCVQWLHPANQLHSDKSTSQHFLLSGSADGAIILWAYSSVENEWRIAAQVPRAHERTVTCIAVYMVSASLALVSSTSSDSFVRIWNASLSTESNGDCSVSLLQSIFVGSRAMVATSLTALPGSQQTFLLALGGLDNHVHFYVGFLTGEFSLACQVKGHQDWIRALDFSSASDTVFLASSSQDKSIRIWKISHRVPQNKEGVESLKMSLRAFIDGPIFKARADVWQVSLESLLLGHEDWVYSVRWRPRGSSVGMGASNVPGTGPDVEGPLCVLSASMDRSMMIWSPDAASGIWINEVTVGELAPSALGFYGGVWSPEGNAILANGYGGSLHLWKNMDLQTGDWQPQLTPSGHSASVADCAWSKTGHFLMSVSHDQTARLFACWNWDKEDKNSRKASWHEIGRPQVHGHDLNCLAMVRGPGNHRYLSGAEEKVARVFEAPGALLETLAFTIGGKSDGPNRDDVQILGASMSALGLSQKPIYAPGRGSSGTESAVTKHRDEAGLDPMVALPDAMPIVLTEPPFEEHLAQNTLWPELHKLYGHGNELFAMSCDHSGKFAASACKAQSETFAQIWLWQVDSWMPAGQLKAHALTVTQLEFSHNDRFLLSVSRDRHLSVFERIQAENASESSTTPYQLVTKVDAHKRIIWTCSWSCCDRFFATGSRDKTVKIWAIRDTEIGVTIQCVFSLTLKSSVTALAWGPGLLMAVGMEDGALELWEGSLEGNAIDGSTGAEAKGTGPSKSSDSPEGKPSFKLDMSCLQKFDKFSCHLAAVQRLAWRDMPIGDGNAKQSQKSDSSHSNRLARSRNEPFQLASCGADYSVRLFNVKYSQYSRTFPQ